MAIQKPLKKNDENQDKILDDFINSAPDSSSKVRGVKKGKKQQITVTITPEIIEQLDKKAEETGLSRAALINIGIRHILNQGTIIGGKP
ncbi:ribbon-helix-helix domain-containing protein (plasmid) [Arsenophonus nasoniae]|uniref:ribbon-helix-helix domain-containing protein n=1 Tax=Arsenophonus nasoniae TaxID=638 RepID=UPI0024689F4C|nr:ribbon-helix-helix domain-containing protein [Arsenophonus nasoniae]WGM18476.1 ribbon-helix-helix domain-containing protein [Arsenophonus nasoniae]